MLIHSSLSREDGDISKGSIKNLLHANMFDSPRKVLSDMRKVHVDRIFYPRLASMLEIKMKSNQNGY